jgi:hypothetical protein
MPEHIVVEQIAISRGNPVKLAGKPYMRLRFLVCMAFLLRVTLTTTPRSAFSPEGRVKRT